MATQAEVAAHLDISVRYVRELASNKIIPKVARKDEYDLDAARIGYIRQLRASAARHRSNNSGMDVTEERAKLARQQALKLEMENAVAKRELISREDYMGGAFVVIKTVSTQLLSLGAKIQHAVAAEADPRECRNIVDSAIRGALEELARLEVVGTNPPVEDEGDDSDEVEVGDDG